jgi:hypothetical protein
LFFNVVDLGFPNQQSSLMMFLINRTGANKTLVATTKLTTPAIAQHKTV